MSPCTRLLNQINSNNLTTSFLLLSFSSAFAFGTSSSLEAQPGKTGGNSTGKEKKFSEEELVNYPKN